MKIIKTILVIMFIACSGCAPEAYWYNKDKTYERAASDCRECLFQAKIEASEAAEEQGKRISSSSKESEAYKQTLFEQCMKEKGYKKTWDYSIDYRVKKGSIDQDKKMYNIAGK